MKAFQRAVLLASVLCVSSMAGTDIVRVLPNGDAVGGREWGYYHNYLTFDATANPNLVYHRYWPGDGSWRNTYMQVGLGGLPGADEISNATLNIKLLSKYETDGDGLLATIRHAANSSTATGDASQKIGGNQDVGTVNDSDSLGWLSYDVTDYLKSDLTNGYSWSAFSFSYDGYSGISFASGEDTANAPYLAVTSGSTETPTTVPVPSSLGLAVLGIAGIMRRRRK